MTRCLLRLLLLQMFTSFDACADRNDVSKVDVIGDAYFAIAGARG